jgi:dipeptidase
MLWPFRLRTIFKSRWWTLAFAAMIVWQAYDFANDKVAEQQEREMAKVEAGNQPAGPSDEQMAADLYNRLGDDE